MMDFNPLTITTLLIEQYPDTFRTLAFQTDWKNSLLRYAQNESIDVAVNLWAKIQNITKKEAFHEIQIHFMRYDPLEEMENDIIQTIINHFGESESLVEASTYLIGSDALPVN